MSAHDDPLDIIETVRAILRGEHENKHDSSSEQVEAALDLIDEFQRANDPANVRQLDERYDPDDDRTPDSDPADIERDGP